MICRMGGDLCPWTAALRMLKVDSSKLDAALQELLAERQMGIVDADDLLVSVIISPDAGIADRGRLKSIAGVSFERSVAVAQLSVDELAVLCADPAVLSIQLSRRLRPKQAVTGSGSVRR